MFAHLRDPRGGSTLLMAGVALLALAGFAGLVPLPRSISVWLIGLTAAAGLVCLGLWWRRRQSERYDLSRLWEEPAPPPEEPYEDTVPEGTEATPYCGWCDEAYPPGTHRCKRCSRKLD